VTGGRAPAPHRGVPAAIGAVLLGAVLLGAVRASDAAHAQDCEAPPTQADINRCARQALHTADARMEAAYRALSASLSPGPLREALRRAQRAWRGWRTAACDYEASAVAGGSAAPMVRAACEARMGIERAAQLERLARCPEGDLGCPRSQPGGSMRSPANRSAARSRSRTRWTVWPSTITSAPRGRVL
jgi:uncharacterized protein YecT (DUF1311 family)